VSVFSLANIRDLAQVRLRSGALREKQLYRSDDVSTIDSTAAHALHAEGIRHVFDLRGAPEQQMTGRGPLETLTGYHHLPFALPPTHDPARVGDNHDVGDSEDPSPAPTPQLTPTLTAEAVGHWYLNVMLDSSEVIISGLDTLSRLDGAAVFHCAAGKDRTGIFAASVLSILGAPDDEIVDDYHASEQHLERVFDRLRAAPYGFFLENVPHAGALLRAQKETMRAFLDKAANEHGGLTELLIARGLKNTTIDQLRARLVD